MALTQVKTSGLADDAVTLAKQAAGTDGQIITYDASGNPVAVGPGTDGQVLTSTGAGSPPAFEDAVSEGTQVKSTGESGGTKFLREDGDGTCSWQTVSSATADVTDGNFKVLGAEGGDSAIEIHADEGDDNADKWRLNVSAGDGTLAIQNYAGGGWENSVLLYGNGASKFYKDNTLMCETSNDGLKFPSGKGIDFSATGDSLGSMGSELLDDYEHGTFTPKLYLGSTEAGYVTADTEGHYVKIGKLVWVNAHININTQNNSTGALNIRGFPYDQDTTESQRGGGYITQWWGQPSGWTNQNIHVSFDTNSKAYLRFYNGSYMGDLNGGHLDDAYNFHYVITYFAA